MSLFEEFLAYLALGIGVIIGISFWYNLFFVWGKEREYYWDWNDRDRNGKAKLKYRIKKRNDR